MKRDRIGKDLVAASLTPLVLALLAKGPRYGYALITDIRELSDGELEWSEGTLYPVLHRLEDRGWIESYDERGETGRQRRYYRLLAEGRRALTEERRQWELVNTTLLRALRA